MIILDFLNDLAHNNDRQWFAANKARYETALEQTITLTAQVITAIASVDTTIANIKPKECIFRIYRDARYSKDGQPYKTNFGVFINRGGRHSAFAGYYLHLEPHHCFVCGGIYRPDAARLQALRTFIDVNFAALQSILIDAHFQRCFTGLSREDDTLHNVPRGFSSDSPASNYLKLKHFIAIHYFADEMTQSPDFATYIANVFTAAAPLVSFLNSALSQ